MAAIIALLGYVSVTFSIAQFLVKSNPETAMRLAPYDGRVIAAYATSLIVDGATRQDRARADGLALDAWRKDPTAVSALATLGLDADARNDKMQARRFFRSAQVLARRNLPTQLWMIEDAVSQGDVRQAVHQYDITLRVFPTLGEILYPVMSSASEDLNIRREIVRVVRRKPLWSTDFVTFLTSPNASPATSAKLLTSLQRSGYPVPKSAKSNIVNALIGIGKYQDGWQYYVDGRTGYDRRYSRDPDFNVNPDNASQLDWNPVNEGGLATNIQSGVFDFSVPASVGGTMLQQMQMLPPGRYGLTGRSANLDAPVTARPYWTLACRGGRELGRIEMPNSNISKGLFSGIFDVPADCPVQILTLTARPSESLSGTSGQIDKARLAPMDR